MPVLDVTGNLVAGEDDAIGTTTYLSGFDFARVWTFNTIENTWEDVSATNMEVGKGYWVFATETGTLVP